MRPWFERPCWRHDLTCPMKVTFFPLAVELQGECLYEPWQGVLQHACMSMLLSRCKMRLNAC